MTSRRPRVVHVTTTDMSLALLLGSQLRAFSAAGYDVIGVSAPGPYVTRLEDWQIQHVALRHSTRAMAPHRDALAFVELWRLFRQLRPDIVHTHNPKPGVYGRVAARCARVPIVVNTVHGLYATPEDPGPRRAVVYGLERMAARCSNAELVQNEEDLETLASIGIPRTKLHLLGNGIDLARFDAATIPVERTEGIRRSLGVEAGDILVGAVGRLVVEKGYRDLLSAAARIRARRRDVHFVVVGPPDPEKSSSLSTAEIEAARADSGVQFLGARDDMEDLYAAMDLLVLASSREGLPRVAIEASAMGVPVIATAVRGCRQVIDDGVTGLLVTPGDVDALATSIERLADDAPLRAMFGAAAQRKARCVFDERRVVEQTLAVYDRLSQRTRVP